MKNYDEFEQSIKDSLEKFRLGYKKRDTAIVDEYIDTLFSKGKKTAVLGTSFGEWMEGAEGAKELVQSDWEYWGDVDIDTAGACINILEDTAFVSLKGTVRYEFEYTEEKYESYLNFVKQFFDSSNAQSRLSSKAKAGIMGFVLTHFNQNRAIGKREYFYPLRINAVMTMEEDRAVFRFMKFSMNYFDKYPELRIDNQMMDISEYYEQQNDFIKAYMKEQRPEIKDIIEEFKKFNEKSFSGDDTEDDIRKFFCSNSSYITDTAGKLHKGEMLVDFIKTQREVWQKLAIDFKAVFADTDGNTAWLVCNGLASKNISQEEGAEMLMSDIKKAIEKNMPSKDKLFVVQKEVANYFLQQAKGEYFLWPVRIAVMLVKEENQWKIHNMSLSYPFYYILEGKYTGV
ncbi:MAG TPA: hypothetical protein VEF53_18385 [Patescibacteria group bacterium]|nr:hypothetical protein [Patescibacteria group bacterium]